MVSKKNCSRHRIDVQRRQGDPIVEMLRLLCERGQQEDTVAPKLRGRLESKYCVELGSIFAALSSLADNRRSADDRETLIRLEATRGVAAVRQDN